jgi:hypothetical protein
MNLLGTRHVPETGSADLGRWALRDVFPGRQERPQRWFWHVGYSTEVHIRSGGALSSDNRRYALEKLAEDRRRRTPCKGTIRVLREQCRLGAEAGMEVRAGEP